MKALMKVMAAVLLGLTLIGCTHTDLGSPCADFGRQCHKEPAN